LHNVGGVKEKKVIIIRKKEKKKGEKKMQLTEIGSNKKSLRPTGWRG